jgi:hypothetical protein
MLELVNTLGRADSMKLHMRWYVEKLESCKTRNEISRWFTFEQQTSQEHISYTIVKPLLIRSIIGRDVIWVSEAKGSLKEKKNN